MQLLPCYTTLSESSGSKSELWKPECKSKKIKTRVKLVSIARLDTTSMLARTDLEATCKVLNRRFIFGIIHCKPAPSSLRGLHRLQLNVCRQPMIARHLVHLLSTQQQPTVSYKNTQISPEFKTQPTQNWQKLPRSLVSTLKSITSAGANSMPDMGLMTITYIDSGAYSI